MAENLAHLQIEEFLDKKFSGDVGDHPYYRFEPWDVEKRPQEVIEQAKQDGINLYDEEVVRHIGMDPHPFQTGFMLSTAKFRTMLAASRAGKTYPELIEVGGMISGDLPISLRFPKGYKTNVRRLITPDNINRFGRLDSSTGKFIDRDIKAPVPEGWDEWNCGFIEGAGVYPEEKICPEGQTIWIGTTHKALWQLWWPRFTQSFLSLFPAEFLNKSVGLNGYTKSEWTIHCMRNTRIIIISYESDPVSFEADLVHACFFDEEAQNKACVTSAINHCTYFSMAMTPYNGMTYTRKLIFDDDKDPENNQVFHATSYDTPYLTEEVIKHRRSLMEQWEIGSRIWGFHTEAKGKPYYDRGKINEWIRKLKAPYTLGRFIPCEEFDGIITRPERNKKGLMNVKIRLENEDVKENQCDVWKIYEKLNDDYMYYLMADSAEGSDIPSEAGDVLASLVMRLPEESKKEKFPQIVASLRSTMKTQNFARVCMYATRYYNNALLCAEGPTRGSYNALFYAENAEYPYWFVQTSIRDSTKKVRGTKGFDTNAATRIALFDGIREVLDEYEEDEIPEIRDEALLQELSGCIVKKVRGSYRPDHTEQSTMDTTICYGQGIYIWRHYSSQVTRNRKSRDAQGEPKGFIWKHLPYLKLNGEDENPVYLGENVEKFR